MSNIEALEREELRVQDMWLRAERDSNVERELAEELDTIRARIRAACQIDPKLHGYDGKQRRNK